jgi:hypothetical protein
MRLLCKLKGCTCDEYCQSCVGCGAGLYDGFIEREMSWLRSYYALRHRWKMKRFYRHHLCAVCHHPMYLTDEPCCCEVCYSDWIPF